MENKVLSKSEIKQYHESGFVIKEVLSELELEYYKDQINNSHLAKLVKVSNKMINAQFLQPRNAIFGLQQIICNKKIHNVCMDLLNGGTAILDGASVLCGRVGVDYRQGWHRDIMQIPARQINTGWFTRSHFHNNVQASIALLPDSCLWLVRGSHKRNFTRTETEAFAGSLKIAPISDIDLPDSLQIRLKPGEAVFYNNHAIHRNYTEALVAERMTIQLGYHSDLFAPTAHFGVINYHEFTDDYLKSLFPEVRKQLMRHIAERNKCPESERHHQQYQDFIMHAFRVG